MPVAAKKSRIVASTPSLRACLEKKLKRRRVLAVKVERNLGIDSGAGKVRPRAARRARKQPAMRRGHKLLLLRGLGKRRFLHNVLQSAVLSSTRYRGSVLGTNGCDLRAARTLQAHVQSQRLSGRSVALMLTLAHKPSVDPFYPLNLDPLMAFAHAVWDNWLPRRMLEQGIVAEVERLEGHVSPWSSIRGPFSVCAATAQRIGLVISGFSWR
eukprot:3518987-Pyramimonas_sp.AAC.1